MVRKSLLVCGILASLLYAGTDVLASIRFGEYHSFTSQAVSELMAKGAPTERFVDLIFPARGVDDRVRGGRVEVVASTAGHLTAGDAPGVRGAWARWGPRCSR